MFSFNEIYKEVALPELPLVSCPWFNQEFEAKSRKDFRDFERDRKNKEAKWQI